MNESTNVVTFLVEGRLILIHDNITSVDVETDIYFHWKRWLVQGENTSYLPALEWVPGIPDPQGNMHPIFYLTNGWRIRTWEGDQTLTVYGHLYVKTGEQPFVPTLGNFNTTIDMQVYNTINSNLATRLDEMAAKLNELLVKGDGQNSMLNALLDNDNIKLAQMNKLEDLTYQILGLSRSNFRIVSPVYHNGNVTSSTVQTFKNREDMVLNKIFKSYEMTSNFDENGRLSVFNITEAAPVAPAPPSNPNASH